MVKNVILYFIFLVKCVIFTLIRMVNISLAKGTAHEKRTLYRNAKYAIPR